MDTKPHIEVILGTMFIGKTTELIRRIKRYEIARLSSQLIKPEIDDRYSLTHAASHDGLKKEAFHVRDFDKLLEIYDPKIKVLGIDEAQFFDSRIVEFTENHVNNGGIAIVAGLLNDYRNKFFEFTDKKGNMGQFVEIADHHTFLKAICTYSDNGSICGDDATYAQRFVDGRIDSYDSPTVAVGNDKGEISYAPRCREHYVFYDK